MAAAKTSTKAQVQKYHIENQCSGRRLYAQADKTWGDGVGAGVGVKYADQEWYFDSASDGRGAGRQYFIRNAHSSRRLFAQANKSWADGWGASPGNDSNKYDDQKWILDLQQDGSYHIRNAHSDRRIFAQANKEWADGVGCGPAGPTTYADNKWLIKSVDGSPFKAFTIRYDIDNKETSKEKVQVGATLHIRNDKSKGAEVQRMEYTVKYTEGVTSSWAFSGSVTSQVTMAVEAKAKAGVPFFGEGEVTMKASASLSTTVSSSKGGGTSSTQEVTASFPQTCRQGYRVEAVATQIVCTLKVPMIAVYLDGSEETIGMLETKNGMKVNCEVKDYKL